ncbi:MAG: lysylphosphatidylglycerol synthase transmembrane domain-containing protein [Gaiella sp.]
MTGVLQSLWFRAAIVLAMLALAVGTIWWRGPDWNSVYHAFDFVAWRWIALAFVLNLLSVVLRSVSWRLTIGQALPPPEPPFPHVFSAFAVGLLGNAALPARAGEVARVAVLRRHLDRGHGTSAALLGTVLAHRLFDLFPVALLVAYVIRTAKIPHWAERGLWAFMIAGLVLLGVAIVGARGRPAGDRGPEYHERRGAAAVRRLLATARTGLAVLRAPLPAAGAIVFQILGWFVQLLAVWSVTEAFEMDVGLPAAALVLLLMNIATIFPLWPGNFGLLQAAVALPLVQYGVAYGTGFAYGLALQAIEMSVGVGVGLIFLAREGMSMASLRSIRGVNSGGED